MICAARIRAIAELLLGGGAKLLVIACNTATSIGADVAREVAAEHGVEVVPVVEPQAEIAAAITDNGKVGVLATPNTVASGCLPAGARRTGAGTRGDRGRGAGPGALHPGRLALRRGGRRDGPRLLRAAEARRGRHADPRLHPLPAGGADAAADPRSRRPPGQRRPRRCRGRPAHARAARPRPLSRRRGRLPLPLHRRRRLLPRSRHPLPADAAWATSSGSKFPAIASSARPNSRLPAHRRPMREFRSARIDS